MSRFTPAEFEIFKEEFKMWQEKLGLSGWKVYFKYEKFEDNFAEIIAEPVNMVATVRLNKDIGEKDEAFADPRIHAKHEAMHLLIARLEQRAYDRFLTSAAIVESAEELARKLENLIT